MRASQSLEMPSPHRAPARGRRRLVVLAIAGCCLATEAPSPTQAQPAPDLPHPLGGDLDQRLGDGARR